jgi:SAM-dependent methyltransferase
MSIEVSLEWSSPLASHRDRLVLREAVLQANGLWAAAGAELAKQPEVAMDASPWCEPRGLPPVDLPRDHFRLPAEPVPGRFYPRMAFSDLAQGPRDMFPVRLLDVDGDVMRVDPNHPLADRAPRLILRPCNAEAAPGIPMADLFQGPGLQQPPADPARTYFAPAFLSRADEAPDELFYAKPRLVHHLDAACRSEISRLYGRFLKPGMRVLDLMASWTSHLPNEPEDLFVAGLGMNGVELEANLRLSERVVQDLNTRPNLPWADATFDLVLCTASIEYLVRPQVVMAEVKRVLRPGGACVVTFSDRWFPTKAIRVWGEIHPFERMALVLSLFAGAGFSGLQTESLRGLARPADDKYIAERVSADPLFGVWGLA